MSQNNDEYVKRLEDTVDRLQMELDIAYAEISRLQLIVSPSKEEYSEITFHGRKYKFKRPTLYPPIGSASKVW